VIRPPALASVPWPVAALALALTTPALAQQPVNPIHPLLAPLDAAGKKTTAAEAVSLDKTCGACHDAPFITAHTGHAAPKAKATCAQCHLDGGRLDVRPETLDAEGRLVRAAVRIGTPRPANCGACHGVVSDGAGPVLVPPAFEAAVREPGQTFSLTEGEGAVVAPQRMSDAFLNLEGKAGLTSPWDVHAAKLVDCVACHYAANNPGRVDSKHAALRYLTADPRRPSTAEFLVRPDHRLAEPSCRGCHDAQRAHAFLPYRERHLAVLSCQTCHLAQPTGPALEMVDATVVTAEGTPARRYRNVTRRPGEALNAAMVAPFRPLLIERVERDGVTRLAPVNTVSRYRWVSGPDRAEVPWETVVAVYREGSGWAPAILEQFDADRDGRVDSQELRLDSPAKTRLVADRLRAAGVIQPEVEGLLETYPLTHGVPSRERALKACDECHAGDSRLTEQFLVAGYLPGGTPPRPKEGARVDLAGALTPGADGSLVLLRGRESAPGRLHVLGHSRQGPTNTIGFLLFAATFLGVLGHAFMRWLLRRRREPQPEQPGERAYLFGRYERIWHWTMALSGALLIASGLEIHNAGRHWLLELPRAVSLHNAFAVVLILNAFLALFYHLATRAIRNFIPAPHGLLARILDHMADQSRGIFYGGPHPANAPGHKLNPLQQLTYLGLLNVVFPLQIGTGLLVWAAGHWPEVAVALGGLSVLAPLHNLGSWLFLSFFVIHVYLVSTGRTVTAHLTSMVTGYGDLGHAAPAERS
jgi:thiosulfate reductase cytochrome b subunit